MSATRDAGWWRADLPGAAAAAAAAPAAGGIAVRDAIRGDAIRRDAGGEAPFLALLAFTFVLLLSPQGFFPALAPLRLGVLTAALALLTYLYDRLREGLPLFRWTPELLAAAGIALWGMMTIPFSYHPGGSVGVLVDSFAKTLVIFFLLAHVAITPARLGKLLLWLSVMAGALALYGVKAYATGEFIHGSDAVLRIVGFESPLTHNPNDLALILNLILPLVVATALSRRRRGARLALFGCAALIAAGIVLTFSRAGFLCLVLTSVLYFWKIVRRPGGGWAFAALGAALLCAAFLLPSGYAERISTIVDTEADPTGSAQEREHDTLAALDLVARNPIVGAGLGMDILALNEARGPLWKHVHNVYLEYAVDLGLPGLLLFLVVLVGCLRQAGRARRAAAAHGHADLFLIAEGIQVSLLSFSLAGMFHPVAYNFFFYYIGGLALAAQAAVSALPATASAVAASAAPSSPVTP